MNSKKNLEAEVKNKPDCEVFFFDESRFGTHSRIGHGWFKTGTRTSVKHKLGFKNFYVYSAVSPKSGDNLHFLMPNVNSECFNVFIKEFSIWLNDKKALLLIDQAGWHTTTQIEIPENVTLIFLPPYSPELNPTERLWQHIKDAVLKNMIYDRLSDLENKVCNFIKEITTDTIKSVCNVNYMPYYL